MVLLVFFWILPEIKSDEKLDFYFNLTVRDNKDVETSSIQVNYYLKRLYRQSDKF